MRGERQGTLRALLLTLAVAGCARAAERPAVGPTRFAAAPSIDGKLDDAAWGHAPEVGPFFDWRDPTRLFKNRTTFKIGYDNDALYLALICRDHRVAPSPARQRMHDDSGVFQDHPVEVFVQPNRAGTKFFQFVCAPDGSTWDARNTFHPDGGPTIGAAWNGDWSARTHCGEHCWTIEMALPFATLGARPEPGAAWGLGVNRNVKGEVDVQGVRPTWFAMWSPSPKGFQYVEDFGDIRFGGEAEIARALHKQLTGIQTEAESLRRKIEDVMRGAVPREDEFRKRLNDLFAPVAAACARTDSPYVAVGEAKAGLIRARQSWKELYYDIRFALLLGE